MAKAAPKSNKVIINAGDLAAFLEAVKKAYRIIGPMVREGAIELGEITEVAQLPYGWKDLQSPARYGLMRQTEPNYFGFTSGQHSWKRYLMPPRQQIWRGKKNGFEALPLEQDPTNYAFFGVRACELKAILIQDEVMLRGPFLDKEYAERRKRVLIIAVNCSRAGGTCFCASMKTGPRVESDFDLSLTELLGDGTHRFLVEIGSKKGEDLLKDVPQHEASTADIEFAEKIITATEAEMGRSLDTDGLKEILYQATEHPRWDHVANRCLSCSNCTLVCPTCFCFTTEDTTDLTGTTAERVRRWDSCFTLEFSYIHGGSIRATPRSRYRQWLTHKLATWVDQFGTFGCVGCGRGITWCPAGIDITEEATAIRQRAIHTEDITNGDH
jgi:sulfhydrogenase subunit beta (sulfur reductase)